MSDAVPEGHSTGSVLAASGAEKEACSSATGLKVQRPAWRAWWVALGVQLVILLAVPYPKLSAYAFGMPAILRAEMLDPYDPLRGRYLAMDYPDFRREALARLPGFEQVKAHDGAFYLLLESRHAGYLSPVRCSAGGLKVDRSRQRLLKVRWAGDRVHFGNARYHTDEAQAAQLEGLFRKHPGMGFAEFRLDASGHAWLKHLRVEADAQEGVPGRRARP